MITRRIIVAVAGCLILCSTVAGTVWAAAIDPPEDLYKAYYLEHEPKAYQAAKALYDKVAAGNYAVEIQIQAKTGADRCRDSLAAQNFATLMPPDALAYFELKRPGQIFEQLAGMLGLTGKDIHTLLAERPSAASTVPFHVPEEVTVSPALFQALSRFGGAAVAVTSFDPKGGPPSGVMVVHHGDMALVKGLLETGFQFAPTAEMVAGMPTFGVQVPEMGRVTGVLTESLLIVGTGRDLVEGVVARLIGKETSSLAARKDLAEVVEARGDATLFVYVDIQAALKIAKANMSERDRSEFNRINAVCDLDSLRWGTLAAGINDGALGLQMTLRLAEGHHCLAYNLVRLEPMTRQSLRCVPGDAAAIFGLGLNPVSARAPGESAKSESGEQAVTGLDLGREVFGNLQEICAFVIPGDMIRRDGRGGPPVIPNIGVVMAVNDPAKSRALWQQLLSLPGMIGGGEAGAPTATKIGDTDVTSFAIPDFGKIYLAELDHSIVIGATRSAIKAAIRASGKKGSILDDEVMGKIIADLPADSSVMIVGHVGRLAKVATGSGDPQIAFGASHAADLCDNMVFRVGIGQSPNQMTLRMALSGLPDLNKALKKYGAMIRGFAQMAAPPQMREREAAPRQGGQSEDPEY